MEGGGGGGEKDVITSEHGLVPRNNLCMGNIRGSTAGVDNDSIRVHDPVSRDCRVGRRVFEGHFAGKLALQSSGEVYTA